MLGAVLAAACSEPSVVPAAATEGWWRDNAVPEEVPELLNRELPFTYPVRLYAMHVEGNVTLRLYVTATGRVVPESTRIAHSSAQPTLDSAALAGSTRLQFRAARRNGRPVAVSILFPVYYRHPSGPPSP